MDQREANRQAKRAALFLLPLEAPLPDTAEPADAERLREGWSRLRGQLAQESGGGSAPAPRNDPDQLAAWSLRDLVGPLCETHDAPIAQVAWSREATPSWERLRFTCGCELTPGVAAAADVG